MEAETGADPQPGTGGESQPEETQPGAGQQQQPGAHMATVALEQGAVLDMAEPSGPILDMVEPSVRALLARKIKDWPAFRGDRRLEQVRAPVIRTEERRVWVNGKPLTGAAILDTGAMPLLIGQAGMKQLGWGPEDTLPDAVTLGLADGKSSKPFPLTKQPVQFTFNKGTATETSITVRAVVTRAPYDFLIGNVVLWSMGMVVDAWREIARYRVDWREGRERASETEGYVPLDYERDTGLGALPPAFNAIDLGGPLPRTEPAIGGEGEELGGSPEGPPEEPAPPGTAAAGTPTLRDGGDGTARATGLEDRRTGAGNAVGDTVTNGQVLCRRQ